MRACLDEDAVLQEDVGGPEHIVALVDRKRDVMEAAMRPRTVLGDGQIVALVIDGEPAAAEPAVVEPDSAPSRGSPAPS